MRHTIAAIKARGVALCVEAPLRVRSTPPAARSSRQLAASAEPLVTDAEGSNRRFITGLLHICLRVVLRVLPSPSSVRSLLVLLLCEQHRCLSRGWGTIRPLQRRSASDKCSVRCRPTKQRDKFYRNF